MVPKHLKFIYAADISQISPNTLFHWWFIDNEGNLLGSKHKTFNEINKYIFFKKENLLRTKIWNNEFDEIILDFDNKNIQQNLHELKKTIEKLEIIGINKYECYLSGGKGTHLHFRYFVSDLIECGDEVTREDIRKAIFYSLNLNIKIDEALFRTNQMIGMEGFNHRKTNKPKERIIINNEHFIKLPNPINFEYLDISYVNTFSYNFTEKIKNELMKNNKNEKDKYIHLKKKSKSYRIEILEWHINRFAEIYCYIDDGHKRITDMLCRYLWLTTRDEKTTKYYLDIFFSRCKIKFITINQRFKSTINSMKAKKIFLYKEIITKEEFYENYPFKYRGQKAECNERNQLRGNNK